VSEDNPRKSVREDAVPAVASLMNLGKRVHSAWTEHKKRSERDRKIQQIIDKFEEKSCFSADDAAKFRKIVTKERIVRLLENYYSNKEDVPPWNELPSEESLTLNEREKQLLSSVLLMAAAPVIENLRGPDHPETATTYHNIALAYDNQEDYDTAQEWYWNAMEIRERVLGTDHLHTAAIYHNIAGVYSKQGEYEKALEWYQKALVIVERMFGQNHLLTARIYHNIAGVYSEQGKYEEALEWYQKVLEIRERMFGQNHPETATTYNNIAFVYFHQGYYEKALEWNRKSLISFLSSVGPEHPGIRNSVGNLRECHHKLKDPTEFRQFLQKYIGEGIVDLLLSQAGLDSPGSRELMELVLLDANMKFSHKNKEINGTEANPHDVPRK
jgi:tetratricopeptide (TPR) repeat protein